MTPSAEYTSRLAAREASVRRTEAREERVGAARLLLAGVVLALAWSSWGEHWLSALWMLAPVAVFACTVGYHGLLRRRRSPDGRGPATAESDSPTCITSMPLIWIFSGKVASLSCCARRGPGWEKTPSRNGCWSRRCPLRCGSGRPASA